MKKFKLSSYIFITIILTLGFSLSLQSLLAAWQTPGNTPPFDNSNPPVYDQDGSDAIAEISSPYASSLFNVPVGINNSLVVGASNLIVDDSTGNVGIGISNPAYKMHVVGASYLDNTSEVNGVGLTVAAANNGNGGIFSGGIGIQGLGTAGGYGGFFSAGSVSTVIANDYAGYGLTTNSNIWAEDYYVKSAGKMVSSLFTGGKFKVCAATDATCHASNIIPLICSQAPETFSTATSWHASNIGWSGGRYVTWQQESSGLVQRNCGEVFVYVR